MGGFSEISDIRTPPHVVAGRLWANNGFAGILKHINGVEKKEIIYGETLHHTFDPVASGFDPAKDTVIDPTQIDPELTTGELT